MRTNIEIDDRLIAQAIKLSGLGTKRAAVEAGIETADPHAAAGERACAFR